MKFRFDSSAATEIFSLCATCVCHRRWFSCISWFRGEVANSRLRVSLRVLRCLHHMYKRRYGNRAISRHYMHRCWWIGECFCFFFVLVAPNDMDKHSLWIKTFDDEYLYLFMASVRVDKNTISVRVRLVYLLHDKLTRRDLQFNFNLKNYNVCSELTFWASLCRMNEMSNHMRSNYEAFRFRCGKFMNMA